MDHHVPESDEALLERAKRRQEILLELIDAAGEMAEDDFALYAVEVLKNESHQDLLVMLARVILERARSGA